MRLLAQLEITAEKPFRRAYEPDLDAVAVWLKGIYRQLSTGCARGRIARSQCHRLSR